MTACSGASSTAASALCKRDKKSARPLGDMLDGAVGGKVSGWIEGKGWDEENERILVLDVALEASWAAWWIRLEKRGCKDGWLVEIEMIKERGTADRAVRVVPGG